MKMLTNTIRFYLTSIVFTVILSLYSFSLQAQIKTQYVYGYNPQTFVEQHVADSGIQVSNSKFNHSNDLINSNQIGIFTNGTAFSVFPFKAGIVLTTGDIDLAQTPNYNTGTSLSNPLTPLLRDPFLEALVGYTQNTSVLEFDFISVSSEIQFDYVFASEEYPDLVCSDYNDAFAMFVTGPDPDNPQNVITRNIAIIPGSTLPVSINSINPGTPGKNNDHNCEPPNGSLAYSQYYISNMPCNTGPYFEYTHYNGFTTKMTAKGRVIPDKTYKMNIAIANRYDGFNDSGVFIKKKSFKASLLSYTLSSDIPRVLDAIEGCNRVTVTLYSTHGQSSDARIKVTTGGTAVEGIDYQPISGDYNIKKPENTVSFVIDPVFDEMQKPDRSLILYLHAKFYDDNGVFINGAYDTLTVWIKDNGPVVLKVPVIEPVCNGDGYFEKHLEIEQIKGLNNLLVKWTPETGLSNPASLSTDIFIMKTTTYKIVAQDPYGCFSDTIDFTIAISSKPLIDMTVNPTSGCIPLTCEFHAEVDPPNANWKWMIDGKSVSDSMDFTQIYTAEGSHNAIFMAWLEPQCADTLVENIVIEDCDPFEVTVPNIFTPNGDGINDVFGPVITAPQKLKDFQMYIYDRWGKLVFSSTDYAILWEGSNQYGKLHTDGIYYCILYITDKQDREYTYHSSITLKKN
jgi:gliding motility-associated-like protein